jgi:hypothetical protein
MVDLEQDLVEHQEVLVRAQMVLAAAAAEDRGDKAA